MRLLETSAERHGDAFRHVFARSVRGEVRFDEGARALYSTDASNYRQVPIGVVIPRDVEDAVRAVAACREHGLPVLARGGGTSLAGQCCNEAVVIDCSKYVNRIVELDARSRRARVEPGCILDDLRNAAEEHDLTFGPDPATHDHNTLGGMIGNNSCGVHSIMAGRTVDNVHALDVVTYDGLRLRAGATTDAELERIVREGGRKGQIYEALRDLRNRYADLIRERFPQIPRRVSGYSLDQLLPENGFHVGRALVGSEGTCVFLCGAELNLVPSPPKRVLLVIGFPDVFEAADRVPQVLEFGPVGLEGLDDVLVENLHRKHRHDVELVLLPEGRAWLMAEFGGDTQDEARRKAERLIAYLRSQVPEAQPTLFAKPEQQTRLWAVRESGLGATARVPGERDTWPGWEDAAVPPERLGAYLRDFRALLDRYGYRCALYGHFGDGCVHVRIDFDLVTDEGIRRYRKFVGEAAELVVHNGGSLSGEHGDGQSRAALLTKMYGPELLQAFREFKSIWDPQWKMNPGKVVDADPITAHLRAASARPVAELKTHFAYPEDEGSFARATQRCVGVGKCRRLNGGVMCPSYMVTREEKHSTRGRARLLFEMLHQDPLDRGWHSEAVREALDLCLACKGCKRDCPVDVDMATYKAEFFSRYYKGRLRPRAAYSMGLIWWWSRAASQAPAVANLLTQTPYVSGIAKALGDIHRQRRLPAFARESFRSSFGRQARQALGGDEVVLFPDTFNNYFYPRIATAAAEVLGAAGCTVTVPTAPLCCGRPLFAWGMLETAERQLRRILDVLEPALRRGIPVVMLEPSCAATFRDELPNLFPQDERAHALARSALMLGEFLQQRQGYEPPRLSAPALVHVHCNHHAVLRFDRDAQLLQRVGLDHQVLDSGCCGMAGSFGFETEHFDISMKVAERVLLPAVRNASADTLILTDGFSCREQIGQATGRRALHLAEVLQSALRAEATGDRR